MKSIYKIILFVAMFQLVVVMVNVLSVFPYTFYSDVETQELQELSSPTDVIIYFFDMPDIPGLSSVESDFTFGMFVTIFLVVGAVIARATQSWTPIIVVILATSFVPMLTKSLKFFNKIIYNWDVSALMYLGLILGFGILMMVIFTIVETPTHGRS